MSWVGTSNRSEIYYRAADLVIAWPGLATLTELVCNNVPTVCFADGAETPDMRSRSLHLEAAGRIRRAGLRISPDELWELGERARADLAPGAELGPPPDFAHPDVVARLILDHT